jgi:hypothetical protein
MSRPTGNDIVLGRGEVFVDAEDSNSNLTGERFLGDCPGMTINGSVERTQVYSHTGPTRQILDDIATQVDRNGSITCQNISMQNLALMLMASVSETSQTSGSVSAEKPIQNPVEGGKWYQAGQTASDPVGAMDISNFSMTIDPGGTATAATEGTDYEVDLALGRYYIIPGGAADGSKIEVSYDTVSATWDVLETKDESPVTGALRFVGQNARGKNRNVYVPKMHLVPDGELSWISADSVQQLQLSMPISKRGDMAQVYVNGRPA